MRSTAELMRYKCQVGASQTTRRYPALNHSSLSIAPQSLYLWFRTSDQLRLDGVSVSAPTVQNTLNRKGLGSRYERWLKLEEKTAEKEIELTAEQV